jgi:glycosyltransferase involved in cell wall biosynthesis
MLEAASKRIPCIVSNVEPYSIDKEAPVLFVNNQKDWFKHMNYLINNPSERERLGNELYEWAKAKYDYKKIGQARREAFGSLIG